MVNATQSAQVNTEPVNTAEAVRGRRARKESVADQRAHQVGMARIAGHSYRAISKELGISPAACFKAYQRFRLANQRGDEDVRELLLSRLETQYSQLFAKLRAGDPQAHRAATEIVELIADLAGVMPAERLDLQGRMPSITVIDHLEFAIQPVPDPSNPWDEEPALLQEGASVAATGAPGVPAAEEAPSSAG